jgi:hypothetical protein
MKASKLVCFVAFICALVVAAGTSRAAFTDDFDGLRAELVSRSLLLSNSTDKIEIKQKKACDQSILLIDKSSTSLATDIKTAKKVATKMIKAFPNEFLAVNAGGIIFTNNMLTVLLNTYFALGGDVQTEIVTLGGLIAGLPDSSDKLKALAQFDTATNLLALAQNSLTFAQGSALLGKSLKAALKGQTIAINAGGGGGGGTNDTFVADVQIGGGTNDHFVATLLGEPNYTVATSTLDLNGSRGTFIQGDDVTAALCGSFNGAAGTYPLGGCGGYFQYGTPNASFSMVTGTLYIATFNVTITGTGTNASTSGTFAFTGSDGVNTATVTNGQFNLSSVIVFP